MTMANRRGFSLGDLHPEMRDRVHQLITMLGAVSPLVPFEGYRTPERQTELAAQRPPVTRAKAWQSAHQYGLAVDFALLNDDGSWEWPDSDDPHWDELHRIARLCSLRVPDPTGDAGHVQHPDWLYIRRQLRT